MKLRRPRTFVLVILAVAAVVAIALAIAQDQEMLMVRTRVAATDPGFPEYLSRLLGHRLAGRNAVKVHTNGENAFPAMLTAVGRAQHRVSFETYIFGAGHVAERFVSAFEEASRRGVEVRLVLDSVGAQSMDPAHIERLKQAGCQVGWFNPIASWSLEEANYRTHRKALVIDGEIAFVGGIGIADHWAEDGPDYPRWRDTQVELQGPAALDVEAAFNENWIETGGVVEPDLLTHGETAAGAAQAVTVWSSPEGGTNGMKLLYLLAIAAARDTLDIQTPYLITDETTSWSLLDARKRGVRIRLIVEGDKTDAKPVKYASRALYEPLLAAGIEIYEYQPTMMHTKALVADGLLSIVGSANFDNRSFELNDELNVVVFDREMAGRLEDDIERDTGRSTRLELKSWRARPFHVRAREQMWSFFGELF